MSNLVKRMDLRRAKAALPWMPRAILPHSERRAVPPARPTPFGRAARFALLALALCGVLLLSAPAEAQTARILVSNVGQGSDDDVSLSGNDHAQLFHTAGATNGYTLTSLTVVSEDAQGDSFSVKICLADNTTEFPTSTCTGLREPDSFAAGSLEFTHPGMHLNRNDNYVAVFNQTDTGSVTVTLDSTTSGGQDSTGLTGWSIKDKFDWKSGGTWRQKGGGDEAIQITVNGYETPANQDATGRPIILASPEGAPILFADTSRIADGNGLPFTGSPGSAIEFVYSYQWIRVDGGTETHIGADSPSYLLVDADIGNVIKVQVSFADRATYSETVTSLPFGPIARPAGPSQTPSTLVSNTGQSASATANITQQYAMEFTLGSYGQGYELSSVSIELAAVPSSVTVSLWIGDHSSQSSAPYTKLFDFENPSPFVVGMNKFTAPAGVLAYQSVHYYIVLSDFGSSLSINETTSDAEDAGGETGATLADNAGGDSNVLRLAVEGSRRARGILASTYAQPFTGDQEIISVGDDCCFRMSVGAADRYLIRGFSWRSDDTTSIHGGISNPWNLRDGSSSSDAKLFRLINTREVAGITEFTAPQGATVVGGSKTYTFQLDFSFLSGGARLGAILTRIFATKSTGYDDPSAAGVTLSPHGDISAAANALMAVLGEPLDAMVQNLGQTNNSYARADTTNKVLSQGFTTGSDAGGYELQGIGVNIEGSSSSFPDGPTSVSVAVHADSSGQPGAKLFDLVSPTEYAAGHSFFEAPPGTTLEASTSYVLVWRHLGGTEHRLQRTSIDSEDSGALTAFSIANVFYRGADLDNLSANSGSNALAIAVYGGRATTPVVTAVALTSDPGTDATYAIDDAVNATVTFSEAVDITGAPQLELDFDGAPKTANCAAATNTTTMVCSYTVAENDLAPNGIAIAANKLTLNGGAITLNGAARTAVLTHSAVAIDSGHKVDGVRPTLVTTGNDAPRTSADGTQVIYTFSEDIGSVTLNSFNLEVDNGPNQQVGATATISGKTVTVTLLSVLTIQYGQAIKITLGTGSVRDTAGNRNSPIEDQAVTNKVPQPPAVISTVEITSDPGMDQIYATNDDIEVTATFDQAVTVTGTPRILLLLGGGGRGERWAEYASGSGTTALVFSYPVVATDESDTDGIEVGKSSLLREDVDLNGGTITVVASGEDASLSYSPVPSDNGHRVNWARPTLSSAATFGDGTTVRLTFSENLAPGGRALTLFTVKVDGTAVTLSGTVATVSGRVVTLPLATALTSATQTVTVSYAQATTGTVGVQDLAGNDADSFTDQMVTNAFGSAAPLTVTGVEITSSSLNGFNINGETIRVGVTFSAAVDITGSPQLELDFDGAPKAANCAAATNTTTMECSYTIGGNDSAPNGIAIAANKITLNGGTITATGSTTINANLDHGAVAIDAGQKVDGIRPTLVTTGADAPTTSADGTQVILTFSETISSVDRTLIVIMSGTSTLSTTEASLTGTDQTTVELTLTTALTASATNLTVALAVDAVRDGPGNGISTTSATPVINAVGATTPPPEVTLVKNTGQSVGTALALSANVPKRAQAFTTGANTAGYTLGSIGFYFGDIADTSTAGGELTVTLNKDDNGDPGDALCTLNDPESFTLNAVNTFDAPTTGTDPCPTLAANTAYFVVIERVTITTSIALRVTTSTNEDTGGSAGWSIGNERKFFLSGSWDETASESYQIEVRGTATTPTVTDDDIPPPPPERGFIAADESQDAIALSWWSERGATEYQLEYRKRGDSGAWTRVTRGDFDHLPSTSGNRSLTGIATGLDCNTTYDFRIRLRGSGNILFDAFGPYTETSHKTGECARDDRPTNLMYTLTPDCATLTWTAPTMGDYTGVRIRRLSLGEYNYRVIHESLNSRPTNYRDCTHTGDGYGDGDSPHYAYMVTYIKSGARGIVESNVAYSGFAEYGPAFQDHLLATPRNVRLTRDTDSQRRMTWEASPSWSLTIWAGLQGGSVPARDPWITGYVVERREFNVRGGDYFYFTEDEDWEVLREGDDGNTSTSFTDNEQANGRKFVYRIMTTNTLGTSSRYAIFDWLWDSPHRDAVIALAATDTTEDGGAGNGETNTGNAGDGRTNNAATGAPTIDGTAQVGETLTASTSGITDADGLDDATYRYQWTAGGSDIDGATGSTYALTSSEQGQTIQVRVSFTDDADNQESLTSVATVAVAAPSNTPATGTPAIAGAPRVGETLTASTSDIADQDGLTNVSYSYQWIAGGSDIAGATGSSYTLTSNEQGKTVQVRVSFADDAGNNESLTSAATAAVAARPTLRASLPDSRFQSARHNGADDRPQVIVAFSLPVASFEKTTRSVSLTGATVSSVRRHEEDGLENAWIFFLDPDGNDDIVFRLVASQPCDSGGICTGDGTTLSAAPEPRVLPGPEEEEDEPDTGAVAPRPPLTATFSNVPTSHDGSNFTFDLNFSEEFGISYVTLRDDAFSVTGGTVNKAKRMTQGSNIGWTITVTPDSAADVTIVLPVTTDCNADGAVCTGDGRKLSNRLEFTVSGSGG